MANKFKYNQGEFTTNDLSAYPAFSDLRSGALRILSFVLSLMESKYDPTSQVAVMTGVKTKSKRFDGKDGFRGIRSLIRVALRTNTGGKSTTLGDETLGSLFSHESVSAAMSEVRDRILQPTYRRTPLERTLAKCFEQQARLLSRNYSKKFGLFGHKGLGFSEVGGWEVFHLYSILTSVLSLNERNIGLSPVSTIRVVCTDVLSNWDRLHADRSYNPNRSYTLTIDTDLFVVASFLVRYGLCSHKETKRQSDPAYETYFHNITGEADAVDIYCSLVGRFLAYFAILAWEFQISSIGFASERSSVASSSSLKPALAYRNVWPICTPTQLFDDWAYEYSFMFRDMDPTFNCGSHLFLCAEVRYDVFLQRMLKSLRAMRCNLEASGDFGMIVRVSPLQKSWLELLAPVHLDQFDQLRDILETPMTDATIPNLTIFDLSCFDAVDPGALGPLSYYSMSRYAPGLFTKASVHPYRSKRHHGRG